MLENHTSIFRRWHYDNGYCAELQEKLVAIYLEGEVTDSRLYPHKLED